MTPREIIANSHRLLVWAADSFAAHAKSEHAPDAIDAYLGREQMCREAAAQIQSLTSAGCRILGPGELDPETVEKCAEVVEPKGSRPCGCDRCDCGNVGDRELVTAWDQQAESAFAIRALAKETVDKSPVNNGDNGHD